MDHMANAHYPGNMGPMYVSPAASNISPLSSNVSPLGGKVSPLASNVSPLGGKVSPLGYGPMSPNMGPNMAPNMAPYHHKPKVAGAYTSAGSILVLFILLVIITRKFHD